MLKIHILSLILTIVLIYAKEGNDISAIKSKIKGKISNEKEEHRGLRWKPLEYRKFESSTWDDDLVWNEEEVKLFTFFM